MPVLQNFLCRDALEPGSLSWPAEPIASLAWSVTFHRRRLRSLTRPTWVSSQLGYVQKLASVYGRLMWLYQITLQIRKARDQWFPDVRVSCHCSSSPSNVGLTNNVSISVWKMSLSCVKYGRLSGKRWKHRCIMLYLKRCLIEYLEFAGWVRKLRLWSPTRSEQYSGRHKTRTSFRLWISASSLKHWISDCAQSLLQPPLYIFPGSNSYCCLIWSAWPQTNGTTIAYHYPCSPKAGIE